MVLQTLEFKAGETYGLEMVEASNGLLKRGTVYVVLHRLEEAGLLASRLEEDPGPRMARRIYRMTEAGKEVLEAHRRLTKALASAKGRPD